MGGVLSLLLSSARTGVATSVVLCHEERRAMCRASPIRGPNQPKMTSFRCCLSVVLWAAELRNATFAPPPLPSGPLTLLEPCAFFATLTNLNA